MQNNIDHLKIAIVAAVQGGQAIMNIYADDFTIEFKEDNTPVTAADLAANAIINKHLEATGIPIISEENIQLDFDLRSSWEQCWIVDPLDGTKEFINRNGEFTVNIALCRSGDPILGVIYVPVTKEIYYANVTEREAYKTTLTTPLENISLFKEEDRIFPAKTTAKKIRVIGSRSHMNKETLSFIEGLKQDHSEVEIVSKGSSLKFCLVAEGKADVYPRFAPTMEWDTAAGHAICKSVGLEVIDQITNKPMVYNRENLHNPYFLVR